MIFFPVVKSHSIWPEAETLFYSQNENFHNSVTSAFHRGYRTFTVDPEKSLVPAFFKVSISDHLFVNLESGKIKYCIGKSLEKVLNFGSKNL